MKLMINSKTEEIKGKTLTIPELLKLKDIEMPEMVSMQLNNDFIKKTEYDNIKLKENDKIEFLYFMGGGSK